MLKLLLIAAVFSCVALASSDEGEKWAIIVAGSSGWGNYRHQADAYHAFQVMKSGGLDDDHIIMIHTDDIAHSLHNPHKGTIINAPNGTDVYHGVTKDYTGLHATAKNFLAALAGDKTAVSGGSGKVLQSGPNDTVFIYYVDHGGVGVLGSGFGKTLYGKDLVDALKAKAARNEFKQLVFYIEACESGSIFDGTLPDNIKIYATTAANGEESSWGCYCPGQEQPPPSGYNTCLGDLYSVAFLENIDVMGGSESLETQFKLVQQRVSQNGTYTQGSHVMQFGDLSFDAEPLSVFMGNPTANGALPSNLDAGVVSNRDADLLFLGLTQPEKLAAEISTRQNLDAKIRHLAATLATSKAEHVMTHVGSPAVLDWDCFKSAIETFESVCTPLGQYGLKYTKTFANLCNAGVSVEEISAASTAVCH